jgi:hypothetical protein
MTSLAQRTASSATAPARLGGGRGEVPTAWGITALVLFGLLSIAISLYSLIQGHADVLRPMTETVDLP